MSGHHEQPGVLRLEGDSVEVAEGGVVYIAQDATLLRLDLVRGSVLSADCEAPLRIVGHEGQDELVIVTTPDTAGSSAQPCTRRVRWGDGGIEVLGELLKEAVWSAAPQADGWVVSDATGFRAVGNDGEVSWRRPTQPSARPQVWPGRDFAALPGPEEVTLVRARDGVQVDEIVVGAPIRAFCVDSHWRDWFVVTRGGRTLRYGRHRSAWLTDVMALPGDVVALAPAPAGLVALRRTGTLGIARRLPQAPRRAGERRQPPFDTWMELAQLAAAEASLGLEMRSATSGHVMVRIDRSIWSVSLQALPKQTG